MAQHIDTKSLKAMRVVPYKQLRPQLESGDLLFASGQYLVSKAIQKMTDSPWSHVGIVFRLDSIDRVLLLESVESVGVRFAPLSKYLHDYADNKPYKGMLSLARCSHVSAKLVNRVATFGIDELTRPYDKDEIAGIVARIALKRGKRKQDREYICSELVYECFASAGKQFAYNPKGFISPEDVWVDSQVELLGRIL